MKKTGLKLSILASIVVLAGCADGATETSSTCEKSVCLDSSTLINCINGVSQPMTCELGCENDACISAASCTQNTCKDAMTLNICSNGVYIPVPCAMGCSNGSCQTSSNNSNNNNNNPTACTVSVCKDASILSACVGGVVQDTVCPYGCENGACKASCVADVCKDASTLLKCNAGVSTEEICPQGCENGQCKQACTANFCLNETTLMVCDANGNAQSADCPYGCSNGACKTQEGGCVNGALQCNGNDLEVCSNSTWTKQETCANGCSNGACNPKETVVCAEGAVQCAGNFVQTCSGNAWQTAAAACPNGCENGKCKDNGTVTTSCDYYDCSAQYGSQCKSQYGEDSALCDGEKAYCVSRDTANDSSCNSGKTAWASDSKVYCLVVGSDASCLSGGDTPTPGSDYTDCTNDKCLQDGTTCGELCKEENSSFYAYCYEYAGQSYYGCGPKCSTLGATGTVCMEFSDGVYQLPTTCTAVGSSMMQVESVQSESDYQACSSNSCSADGLTCGGGSVTTCTNGATQCSGSSVQTCTAGQWMTTSNCPNGCSNGKCIEGGNNSDYTDCTNDKCLQDGTTCGELCKEENSSFYAYCYSEGEKSYYGCGPKCSKEGSTGTICMDYGSGYGYYQSVATCTSVGSTMLLVDSATSANDLTKCSSNSCSADGLTCGGGSSTCTNGATQCSGNSVQTCTSGQWKTTETCPNGCSNGQCIEGGDDGTCDASFKEYCSGNTGYYCYESEINTFSCDSSNPCAVRASDNYAACVQSCSAGNPSKVVCESYYGLLNYAITYNCVKTTSNSYAYFGDEDTIEVCDGNCTDGVGCDGGSGSCDYYDCSSTYGSQCKSQFGKSNAICDGESAYCGDRNTAGDSSCGTGETAWTIGEQTYCLVVGSDASCLSGGGSGSSSDYEDCTNEVCFSDGSTCGAACKEENSSFYAYCYESGGQSYYGCGPKCTTEGASGTICMEYSDGVYQSPTMCTAVGSTMMYVDVAQSMSDYVECTSGTCSSSGLTCK